jgi:prephenate dehydrogenase
MELETLAIVGLGLIGGSVGLAARRALPDLHIIGVDRDGETLVRSRERGIVHEIAPSVAVTSAASADMILFCTPVDSLVELVLTAAVSVRPGAVLTDAGSTKSTVVNEIEKYLCPGIHFVGGHPLAGSEKQGLQYADAELFRDRAVVLTPTANTDKHAAEGVAAFWKALGARVVCMTPEEHDHAVALTSHLPHLVASALSGILPRELADLTASGFRDTTRIAASDPALWSAIFSANRDEVLDALTLLEERLQRFRTALESDDKSEMHKLLAAGRELRKLLNGPG